MACPGGPGSRREHQAAASRWVEQPSRETEHRGPRHGTRSQSPALRTPPPSRAAHAASGRCQKPPKPPRRRKQGGLCTQDPGPRVSSADLGAAAWLPPLPGCRAGACWRDVPRRIGALWPRPGPTPARREEQNRGPAFAPALSRARRSPGGCSCCSLGDAAFLRRSCPAPPGHITRLRTLGASSPIR